MQKLQIRRYRMLCALKKKHMDLWSRETIRLQQSSGAFDRKVTIRNVSLEVRRMRKLDNEIGRCRATLEFDPNIFDDYTTDDVSVNNLSAADLDLDDALDATRDTKDFNAMSDASACAA